MSKFQATLFQVSSLWCATDEPIESFEYIGQFSPLLGHKLELFQWTRPSGHLLHHGWCLWSVLEFY